MANKKKTVDTSTLPINFFGDVLSVQSSPIKAFEYHYGDTSVEVKYKPSLSQSERNDFMHSVWAVYYSKDKNGNMDYRPYMFDVVMRYLMVIMYCVNVPIDTKQPIGTYERFLVETDFCDELEKHLIDFSAVKASCKEYIDRMVGIHTASVQNDVEIAIGKILSSLAKIFTAMEESGVSINDMLGAIQLDGGDGGETSN